MFFMFFIRKSMFLSSMLCTCIYFVFLLYLSTIVGEKRFANRIVVCVTCSGQVECDEVR